MPNTTAVRDLMTRDVATLRPETPISEAADELAAGKYGAMPVVDADGKLVGLLRDEDLIASEARIHVPTYLMLLGTSVPVPGSMKRFEHDLHKFAGSTVAEVMDDNPHTVTVDATLEDVATMMHDADVTHIPVLDDGRVVGLVARSDIVRYIENNVTALRPVWAEIDLAALRANVAELGTVVAPARVLAVVKADGYGHGAVDCGRAALEAGVAMLGVALVEEGVELREAGIEAPILVLSEPVAEAATTVVAYRLTPAVYTASGIEALAKAVIDLDGVPLPVHLKVDTGMHRVGAAPEAAPALAELVDSHRELRIDGLWTHLAVADEPGNPYTDAQLEQFETIRAGLAEHGHRPEIVHAANTAGALAFARARYDLVRPGIGIYGIAPAPELAPLARLRPVMAVKASVSFVKRLPAGAAISYGLRYRVERPVNVVTVPIGYGDGVPRNLSEVGGEVLIRGRRCPIAGTVTMDQLMVDVGDDAVEVGEEVVLIGRQDTEEITAAEWAARMGTIPYEIVRNIGPRVPRRVLT